MDWKAALAHTGAILKPFRAEYAATAKGFHELHDAALAEGALGTKEKALIALSIGIS